MSTYTPIASQILSTSTATVTFSSIPQNYTDLVLVINGNTNSDDEVRLRFNNDSGSNYSEIGIYGNGSGPSVTKYTNTSYGQLGGIYTSSGVGTNIIQIMNYANENTYKTVLARASSGNYAQARVITWRGSTGSSTEAINRIDFYSASGTFSSGTIFTIYGIAAGNSSAKATGGNIVTTDGSYWYHTFTSSGTFTPSTALTCDYLVVAGGGGSGYWTYFSDRHGGGGAGGLRSTVTATGGGGSLESALSLSANTVYPAIVGAGGAGGRNGSNSTFATITSTGGGSGGVLNDANTGVTGSNGGSGGGGSADGSGTAGTRTYSGGSGTTNQGYAGGTGTHASGSWAGGGGGGGAGSAGTNGNTSRGGNGGNGVQITALATPTRTGVDGGYYAGGGSGSGNNGNGYNSTASSGTGGLGGGGAWNVSGKPNTGAGAGANNQPGGSGIIIIRYAV